MSVGGVSASNQVSGQAGLAGGGLTPDAVMLYCAAQLNHLDADIQQHMAQQQVARDQQDKLGKLKALLAGDIPDGDAGAVPKQQIMQAMKDAYDSLVKTDPAGADQLNQAFHEFITTATFNDHGEIRDAARDASGQPYNLGNLTGDKITWLANQPTVAALGKNTVIDAEMKKLAARVDPVLSDVGKGADLEMINLQSMVSQRQMAVQIATQMISKMNETISAVTSNLKS